MTAGTPASPVCTPGHTSTPIGKGTAMARERKPRPGCRTPRPSRRPPIRHRRACRKAQTRTASRGSTLSTDAPVPLRRECWRVGRAISRPDSAGSARGLPRRPTPTPQDAEPQGISLRAAVLSCRRSAMMRAKVSVSASFRMRPQGPPKFQAIRGSGSPSDRRNPRSFPAADSPHHRHIRRIALSPDASGTPPSHRTTPPTVHATDISRRIAMSPDAPGTPPSHRTTPPLVLGRLSGSLSRQGCCRTEGEGPTRPLRTNRETARARARCGPPHVPPQAIGTVPAPRPDGHPPARRFAPVLTTALEPAICRQSPHTGPRRARSRARPEPPRPRIAHSRRCPARAHR